MATQSFLLVDTKPIPIYETENGTKYTSLNEIVFALTGENRTREWIDTLEYAYNAELISFKHNKTDRKKEFLIKLDDLKAFETQYKDNPLLRQLKAINNMEYEKPELMLVQEFCDYMNEHYCLNCKRNSMFRFLRDNGFLEKVDTDNVPTQLAIDLDLFQMVYNILQYDNKCTGSNDYIKFNTPYITTKGKEYLTSFVLNSGEFN